MQHGKLYSIVIVESDSGVIIVIGELFRFMPTIQLADGERFHFSVGKHSHHLAHSYIQYEK